MSGTKNKLTLTLSPRAVVDLLFRTLAVLFLAHILVVIGHLGFQRPLNALTMLFDVDLEANIPAFFNVSLLFIGSLCFFLVGRTAERDHRGWFTMSVIFAFLAIDEGSKIHEKLMLFTLRLMQQGEVVTGDMGWLFYAWIIPYGLAVALLLLFLLPWLLRMDGVVRRGLLVSGGIYVFGALFMEAWSGKVAEPLQATAQATDAYPWLPCKVYSASQCFLYNDIAYITLYTVEELAEMTGLILCIGVLLNVLKKERLRLKVRLR